MDYFDYYDGLIKDEKNDFYPNYNLNQYTQDPKINSNRTRNYLNTTSNIGSQRSQNSLSSYSYKYNIKYPIKNQLSNDLYKNNYMYNKINENYNQNKRSNSKYNNYNNYNTNFNENLINNKYYNSTNNFYPSNKINNYNNVNNNPNSNRYLNTTIHTYKSIYDENLKLPNNVLHSANINNNLNLKENGKKMENNSPFEKLHLGNNNLNIIFNQNQILQNKYKVNAESNAEKAEKYINNNLKINNYLKTDNDNKKNTTSGIKKNNYTNNNNTNINKNNNNNNRNQNPNKIIKQKNNIIKEDLDDEINLSELADDILKINKSNLLNKKQKHTKKKIPENKKIIMVETASQTIQEESENIQKKEVENTTKKIDAGTDIQQSLLKVSINIENKQKEDDKNNDKISEIKEENLIPEDLIKKDNIVKESVIIKDSNSNIISNEKIYDENEKKNQMMSSDKNIEEFKNESIELDIPGILKNINLNNNLKESKMDDLVCLISESSEIDNNINLGKDKKRIKFDLKKNICFQFLINDFITSCIEANKKNELKYLEQKNYNQYSKPKKSIIKNFDKKNIKINNNYILCENLAEEDIVPELFEDFEGNGLSDDQIKKLENTLETSVEKSFDKSSEKSYDKSLTQSLNQVINGSITQSYNQVDNECPDQDNSSKKGKGILNKLIRIFSLNSKDKNEKKGNK